ncbi:hypothetical protein [Candidatus Pelagibacter communis]|uniref:hypothetical protein n=1 Tax=Pelagibacter ubique TaxID=198252 RepID=UPI00094C1443|nr:hypothetical protein [Candidatus Pelagibacter ubique]
MFQKVEELNKEQIIELENSYMEFLTKVLLNNNKIHKYCKSAENEINNNYKDLKEKTTEKNLVKTPFERLVSFHLIEYCFKNNINIKPHLNPISSDMFFELDDCYINIDCKTVNIVTNHADTKDISIMPNQVTFQSEPLFKKKVRDNIFSGIHYNGQQKPIINSKPNLTFMFKLVYADNEGLTEKQLSQSSTYKIGKYENLWLALTYIPNEFTLEEEDKKNILQGIKTYHYVTANKNFSSKYKPLNEISSNWLKFKNGSKDFYLDTNLKHPWFKDELAVRGVQQNKYCIILEGMSARLNRSKVRDYKIFEIKSGSSS